MMTIPRGRDIDEVEQYYQLLEEKATHLSPTEEEHYPQWTAHIDYLKATTPGKVVSDFLDTYKKGIEAYTKVVLPLENVYKYIVNVKSWHIPWGKLDYPEDHFPLLTLEDIYCSVIKASRENQELLLRVLYCSYENRSKLMDTLDKRDRDAFVSLLSGAGGIETLSDICWKKHLYEKETDPISERDRDGIQMAINEGKASHGNQDLSDYDYDEDARIQIFYLPDILNGYFYEYCLIRSTIDEDTTGFTSREEALFDEIISRPEGSLFDNLYKHGAKKVTSFDGEGLFKSLGWELPFGQETVPAKEDEQRIKNGGTPKAKTTKKGSNAGAHPKQWLKVSLAEPVIKRKIEEEVWTGIVEDINALDYCDKSDIERGKASKAFGAALIFYSAHSLGLTDEKLFNLPASRAFDFLPAPKTSVNIYLKRLYDWYDKLINAGISKKGNLDEKTFKKWKREDSFRANFIIKNFEAIKDLVKKTTFLLGKAFGVETGLEYESPEIGSDPVLGGALLYNDEVNNKDDGSKILTGLPLSDSYNKQLGK